MEARAPVKSSAALVHDRTGEPAHVLRFAPCPVPVPGPGEILLEMIAAPINPSDMLAIRGEYGPGMSLPAVPGFEGVGHVEALGPGTAGFAPGERLLALRGTGTWARHAVIPAATAIRVPDAIDEATAAQLWINPLTVWLLLTRELALEPGDIVVANAAASGFGRALCTLGRHLGVRVVAVTRSPVHKEELRARGAEAVIDESAEDVPAAVARIAAGAPVRAALDAVGGASAARLLLCLPPGGRLRYYARLSREPIAIEPAGLAGFDIAGFWLRRWVAAADDAAWHQAFASLLDAVVGSRMRLPVSEIFPLKRAAEAVDASAARDKPGKILFCCR